MDFTREPIIQTVITPKEGCKLVVRSSKSSGQEEYFVDAVEVISFGSAIFFRSLERPKSFIVPVNDYEVLEVREARMVLKNVGHDRAIKIGGGREGVMRGGRETAPEKVEVVPPLEEQVQASEEPTAAGTASPRLEKKRDRRRQSRRRRGREDVLVNDGEEGEIKAGDSEQGLNSADEESSSTEPVSASSILTSLLPPPPTLISETIARYRDNDLFKGAFFLKEEEKPVTPPLEVEEEKLAPVTIVDAFELASPISEELPELIKPFVAITPPEYGSFEISEEEAEEIYRQRHAMLEQLHEQVEKATEDPEVPPPSHIEPEDEDDSSEKDEHPGENTSPTTHE